MTERRALRFGDISKTELILVTSLLLFTSALYYRSVFSGFLFDDWEELERASEFEWHTWIAWFSPLSGLWRAMFYLLWAMVFKIALTNPIPYHVAHLGLHLFSIVAVWALVRRLCCDRFAAFVAAFLFAIHKANAFGVIWNSGATDTLAVAFAIPAFCCYLSYRDTEPRKLWLLFVSCVLYYLSIKSKLMAVTLPLLLISYELLCTLQPFRTKVVNILRFQWAYWVISAVYLWAFLTLGLPTEGAYKPIYSLGHILSSTTWYLSRILFDMDPDTDSSTQAVMSVLLAIALLVALVLRNRQMIFGWLWFLVALGPVAPLASHRFETHLYLPIIGVCLYVAALLAWFRARARPIYSLSLVTIIGLGFLYFDLPLVNVNSGFMLTTWAWNQSTLASLRKLLPSDPSGSYIYFYPRPEGSLFNSGSSIRLLYHLSRDKLRVTVGEDKETIGRLIRESNATKLPPSEHTDEEHYAPGTERLFVFEYSPETKQLSDVTGLYRTGSPPVSPSPSGGE